VSRRLDALCAHCGGQVVDFRDDLGPRCLSCARPLRRVKGRRTPPKVPEADVARFQREELAQPDPGVAHLSLVLAGLETRRRG
jgi:hypothetical protein